MNRLAELRALYDFIGREILAEMGPQGHEVVEQAAELYGVTVSDVLGRSRLAQVVRARQAAAWLLSKDGISYRQIAMILGYTDHSTVLYAIRKIEADQAVKALLGGLDQAVPA